MEKIVRSEKEINEVLDKVNEAIEDGSQFPGMSYEEGLKAMYDWLTDVTVDDPFE